MNKYKKLHEGNAKSNVQYHETLAFEEGRKNDDAMKKWAYGSKSVSTQIFACFQLCLNTNRYKPCLTCISRNKMSGFTLPV